MSRQNFQRINTFQYSDTYDDQTYKYRSIKVDRYLTKIDRLLTEEECKLIGITQSPGWVHYANYPPDNVMIFRKPKD